jgi:hypothetical protein
MLPSSTTINYELYECRHTFESQYKDKASCVGNCKYGMILRGGYVNNIMVLNIDTGKKLARQKVTKLAYRTYNL